MVAQTIDLPNIRRFFVPDPGYIIVEADLQRAESQVVAWETGDAELKEIFHSGIDIHSENARLTYRTEGKPTYYQRDRLKRCVYAIQNGGKEGRISDLLDDPAKGKFFYQYWMGRFPAYSEFHRRIESDIISSHRLRNVWGFETHWLDRTHDASGKPSKDLVGHGVPWLTQSTIALTINHAIVRCEDNIPEFQFLMQVHDSVLFQVPERDFSRLLPDLRLLLAVAIPYTDPLVIPVTLAASTKSWGDVEPVE